MERTRQGQEKEEWGMLKQFKVITVYLHRKKVIGPIIDHIFKDKNDPKLLPLFFFFFYKNERYYLRNSSLVKTRLMPFYQSLPVWRKNSSFLVPETPPYKWTVSFWISITMKKHTLRSRVGPRGERQSSSDDCRTVKDSAYRTSIKKKNLSG